MARYSWKRRHPMERIERMGELPSEVKGLDCRFSVMLLRSLPEKMKTRVLAEAEGDMAVDIST
eukprot:1911488-Prorocentrum_lima.AAC.1